MEDASVTEDNLPVTESDLEKKTTDPDPPSDRGDMMREV